MSPGFTEKYDVVVVGAGHGGCEAALAAARMGLRTALLSLNLENVALMPCNPSIGGPAKGPAVQALRVQSDKHAYNAVMRRVLEAEPNLILKEGTVEAILTESRAG